jgi:hypothetical protein
LAVAAVVVADVVGGFLPPYPEVNFITNQLLMQLLQNASSFQYDFSVMFIK